MQITGLAEVLFEKFSVDNLLKGVGDSTFFKSLLKQGGIEASEEMATEVANILSDAAIMGQSSRFHEAVRAYMELGQVSEEEAEKKAFLDCVADVGLAGLGGFLSGGSSMAMIGGSQLAADRLLGNKKAASGEAVLEPYEVKRDAQGDVYVEINADILKGVPENEWKSTVRGVIQKIFGEGVHLPRGTVFSNQKGRGELSNGSYTRMLERTDPEMYADKLRMAVGADGLVSNAENVKYEDANHERADDIVGFNRGKISVSVKGNGYRGDVLTAIYSDGKETFFDVNNLNREKTEAVSPERYAAQGGFTQTGNTTSDSIVPSNGSRVNARQLMDDPFLQGFNEGEAEDTDPGIAVEGWEDDPFLQGFYEEDEELHSKKTREVSGIVRDTTFRKANLYSKTVRELDAVAKVAGVEVRFVPEVVVNGRKGNTTTYTYDRFGNLLTTTDPLGKTETNTYSVLGRLNSTTDRNGMVTAYAYDGLGRIRLTSAGGNLLQYTYTLTGQVRSEQSDWNLTQYTYDELGRNIRVDETPAGAFDPAPAQAPDPANPIYAITLDPSGGLLPAGAQGLLWLEPGDTVELPTPTRAGYTFAGWYLGTTLMDNASAAQITQNCVLTAAWTPITYYLTYDGGSPQTCLYDQEIVLPTTAAPPSSYPYQRLVSWAYYFNTSGGIGTPIPVAYYFALGSTVKNLTIEAGATVNLTSVWEIFTPLTPWLGITSVEGTEAGGDSPFTYTKVYTYDLADNRTAMTVKRNNATVQAVTYTYDTLNRLSTVSENGTLQATYTYDTNGNRASLIYANGVAETYQYNKANWITALTNSKDGQTLSSYDYTYYASGSQKSETDHNNVVTSYTYDDLGRLTQESETGELAVSYAYDANGNRTQMAVTGTENYTVSYTYDANNRLTTEVSNETGTNVLISYTYDDNGNLLSQLNVDNTAVVTHGYDGFNRLISSVTGAGTITYTYNAQGIRTSRTVGVTTTNYLLDGGNVIGEVTGTATTTYLRGVNLISGSGKFYLYDAHGDVVQLTDSTGAVTKTYSYDAFGNEQNPNEEDTNLFRYCGEYYDTETGLYYLRARYYDPLIGRFTQEDPIKDGINWYVYAYNSPILVSDPSGLSGIRNDGMCRKTWKTVQRTQGTVLCANEV